MAVHGALITGIVCAAKGARVRCFKSAVVSPIVDALPFDIEVTDDPSPASMRAPSTGAPPPLDALAASRVSGSTMTTRGTRGREEPPHAFERGREHDSQHPPSGDVKEPAPFQGVTMGAPVAAGAIGLGLGAPNPFVTRNALVDRVEVGPTRRREEGPYLPAPTIIEAKRAADNVLREPARQREREIGLGPEGPVLKALGSAASATTAPVQGRAVFVAVADGTGIVLGIDVVECDGARSGWTQAAQLARAGLAGTKLRMPSTATRAEMRVEVTSAWKIPSGHDPGTDVSVFGVQTSKGDGKQSSSVAVMDVFPKVRTVELSKDLKVTVVVVDPDVIAIKGDSTNAGAKPRRIVQARLLDSKFM